MFSLAEPTFIKKGRVRREKKIRCRILSINTFSLSPNNPRLSWPTFLQLKERKNNETREIKKTRQIATSFKENAIWLW
jgi:hypothetical protein